MTKYPHTSLIGKLISNDHLNGYQMILKNYPNEWGHAGGIERDTSLSYAIYLQKNNFIDFILDYYTIIIYNRIIIINVYDYNSTDTNKITPFISTAYTKNGPDVNLAKKLILHSKNTCISNVLSPFTLSEKMFHILTKNISLLNSDSFYEEIKKYEIIVRGHTNINIEPINIDFQDIYGMTAIMYATYSNTLSRTDVTDKMMEYVEFMINSGANLNIKTRLSTDFVGRFNIPSIVINGVNLLMICAHYNIKNVAELILNSNIVRIDVNDRDAYGNTALMYSCFNDYGENNDDRIEMVNLLLNAGANPNLRSNTLNQNQYYPTEIQSKYNALDYAVESRSVKIVELLIKICVFNIDEIDFTITNVLDKMIKWWLQNNTDKKQEMPKSISDIKDILYKKKEDMATILYKTYTEEEESEEEN